MTVFDEASWEERYRSSSAVWSGRPNAQLVAEAAGLAPGTALDVGSGEGADALWLAGRGWRVTAVDFATAALERAAAHAAALGAEVAGRIRWVHADVTAGLPGADRFDLVSAQYMHLPAEPRRTVFARLAAAVAPGGTLLVVGHDLSDLEAGAHRPPMPEMYFTADEVAGSLDPTAWEIVVAEARSRPAHAHEGDVPEVRDAVLVARRRG
jgi:SAM-dependent methyltransferase